MQRALQFRGLGGLRQQFQQPQYGQLAAPPGGYNPQLMGQPMGQPMMATFGAAPPGYGNIPQRMMAPARGPMSVPQQVAQAGGAQQLIAPQSRPYGGGPGFAKPLSPNPGTPQQAGGGGGGAPQEWKMSIEPMVGGGMIRGYQEGGWVEEQLVKLLREALRENPRMNYGDATELIEDLKREGELTADLDTFSVLQPAWEKAQRLAALDRAKRGVSTKVERDVYGDLIPQDQDALLEPAPGMPTELPEEPLPMAYEAQRRRKSDPMYGQFPGDPHTLGEAFLERETPPPDYTGIDASKILWDARYGLSGMPRRDYEAVSRPELFGRGPVDPGTSVADGILGEGVPPIDLKALRYPAQAFIGQEDPPDTSVGQVDLDLFKQGGTEDTTDLLMEFGKQRQAKLSDPLEAAKKEIDKQISRYHRKLGNGDISIAEFQAAMDAIGASPEHVAEVFGWLGDPVPTRREVEPLVGDGTGRPVDPLVPTYDPTFDEGAAEAPTYDPTFDEGAAEPLVDSSSLAPTDSLEDQYLPSQHPMGRGTWLERGSDDLKEWAAKRNVSPDITFQPATMFSERQIREMLDSRGLGKKDLEKRRAIAPSAAAAPSAVEDIYADAGGYQDALGLTTDDPYLSNIGNYELPPELPEGFRLPYEEEEVSGPSWEGLLGGERPRPLDAWGEGVSVEGLGDKYDELRLPREYLDKMREAGVPTDRAGEYLEHMAWLTRSDPERAGVDLQRYLYGPTAQRDANSVFALASSLFGAPGTGNTWDRRWSGGTPSGRGGWEEAVRFGLGRSGGGIVGLAGGGHVPMIYANGGYIPGYGLGDWVKKWGGKALKGIGSLALKAAPIVAGAWNPLLGAGVGALISGIKNKSLKSALIGGATGYLGGKALSEGLKGVGWADQFGKLGASGKGQALLGAFGAKPTAMEGIKALVGKGAGQMGKLALAGQFGKSALGAAADSPFVHSTIMPMIAQLSEEEARKKAEEEGLMYNSQLNPWSLGHERGIGSQFAAGAGGGGRQAGTGAQQYMYSDGGLIGYEHGGTHATQWLRNQYLMANPGTNTGVTDTDIFAWAQANGVPNTEGGYEQQQGQYDTSRPGNRYRNQFGGGLPGEEGGWDEGDSEWWTNEGDWDGRGYNPMGNRYGNRNTVVTQGTPYTPTVPETPGAVAPGELVEVANTPHENYRAGLQAQTAFATGEGDISGIDPYDMPTDPSDFEDSVTQQWLQSLTPQSAQEGGPIDPSNTLIPSDSLMAEEPSPQIEELGRMALLGGIPEPERSNILQIIQEQYPDLYQQLTNELRTKESQSAGREGIVTEGFIPPFADGGLQSSGAVDDRLAVTKDDLVKEDFEERLAQGKNLQVAAAVAPYEYIVRKDDVFSTPEEVMIAAQQIDPETPAGPQVWDQLVGNLGEPDDQYA